MKKSVLISGKDFEFNSIMAEHLNAENSDFHAVVFSDKQLKRQRKYLADRFDVFLLDVDMALQYEELKDRTIYMTDSISHENSRDMDGRKIFKYQSIKEISVKIRSCINHRIEEKKESYFTSGRTVSNKTEQTRMVCVLGDDDRMCEIMAVLMARVFSMAGYDTACMDMRKLYGCPEVNQAVKGSRSWKDFIYGSLYGRTGNVLAEAKTYASQDEWGVLYFEGEKGRNPVHELEESEKELFFSRIRDSLNVEYAVCMVSDAAEFRDFFEFVILINNGEVRSDKVPVLTGIDKRKIITVNTGIVRDMRKKDDFVLRCSDRILTMSMKETAATGAWKEMLKIAGYIENC